MSASPSAFRQRLGKQPSDLEEDSMTHRRLIGFVAAVGTALPLAVPGVVTTHSGAAGYVYTETNAATGNAILAYARVM